MTANDAKLSPLLILLIVTVLGAVAWQAGMIYMKPGLNEILRAKIVEPVLQECFINSLAISSVIEKNKAHAYETLQKAGETDAFSKTKYRIVSRGKKLNETAPSCSVSIKRAQFLRFVQFGYFKFRFSEKNRAVWVGYLDDMRKKGILAPGNEDIQIVFEDCGAAKKLYDSLQSFFAVSKSYNYNFNY
jgi:hypothetical protein